MATQLIPFMFQERHPIRVTLIGGEPCFCLRDVCIVLEIKNQNPDRFQLDSKGVTKNVIPTSGGEQEVTFINEPNLYRVIFRSNKPEAKAFQDWVFNDVLPTIRKTGAYVHPNYRPEKTRKALPGGLTLEQQDAVKVLVKSRVETLPHDQQAKGAITCWSAIKSKFGVSYKEVPASEFPTVLSLVARLPLENRDTPKALPFEIHYPLESAAPPVGCSGLGYYAFAQAEGWVDPCYELLMQLRAAGLNVDGPIYSHQAARHVMAAMYNALIDKAIDNIKSAGVSLPYAPVYLPPR